VEAVGELQAAEAAGFVLGRARICFLEVKAFSPESARNCLNKQPGRFVVVMENAGKRAETQRREILPARNEGFAS
jgi:hypothetical protein